ncbi:alpha/beta hydrolase [Rhodobacteraceae bacterium RKSG542]|uniref:alpha/beta hydrolase n=1 Tax=Pseudovibrio flavus TaxID=2529854 RepID=UPI0012BC2A16|nr:alpha/beta hydrolase [Pseudovibrio flavus]MTI16558.1 alpha/beta hydrolase [Pseudovibrio flavus]
MARKIWIGLLLSAVFTATHAKAEALAPYKDELFSYPSVLEQADNGQFVRVDYNEMRDINGRDATPVVQAKRKYISTKPSWHQRDATFKQGELRLDYFRVGKANAKTQVITIYLHGKGGSRLDGVKDGSFGGNFNRIKNLMIRNKGVYLSPDFSDFADTGQRELSTLIAAYAEKAPNASIFLSCGSMGSLLCYRLANEERASRHIDGYLILGGSLDESFLTSPAFARKVPIYFGHGTKDIVYPWQQQVGFYKAIRAKDDTYPASFALFEAGTHGTPIRMTDWRLVLNWMMSQP